ncbi:hypothetical protein [Paracoccus pacificus]|uniref:Uncharacterized protein n=1 Tax=Paracoccus pacificus TaxID=1463598 RepID=A0ABW4R5Y6_9RHOB
MPKTTRSTLDKHCQERKLECEDLEKLRERSISKLDDDAALNHIGTLIDASRDAGFTRGADRAIYLLDEFAKRDLNVQHGAVLEYFRSNAWAVKEMTSGIRGTWAWEHPEREQQILALSRAAAHPGLSNSISCVVVRS